MDFKKFKNEFQQVPVDHYPHQVAGNPVVSVRVQTYQHVDYIEKCLEGILMQKTDFPFEILLGEDESTDGTREVCLKYAEKHPDKIRLFLHKRENNIEIGGRPTGRFNMLYNQFSARGKYITICEGDDYWTDPLKLQKQVDFMEANADCSLLYHNTQTIFEDNSSAGYIKEVKGVDEATKFSLTDYIKGNGLNVWTVAMMYKTSIISKIPDFLYQAPFGDLPLKLICGYHGKIGYIPETMAVYRRAVPGSWSENQKDVNWVLEHIHDRNYIYDMFDKFTHYKYHSMIQETNKRWVQDKMMNAQSHCNRREQFKLMRKYFDELIRLNPKNKSIWLRFLFGYHRIERFSQLKHSILS